MKDYCVDLEIAKELKENGFPQECMFRYCCFDQSEKNLVIKYINESNFGLQYITDAPISGELLKELPKFIETDGYLYKLIISPNESFVNVSYESNSETLLVGSFGKKLQKSLATIWLWCKKEGYIK